MADPFSTVAAVVSFVDVAVRACKGIYAIVDEWKDAPNSINRVRQTAKNLESMLDMLRLYVLEYESSRLFREQQQLLPDVVKNQLRDIDSDLKLLSKCLSPPSTGRKVTQRMKWVLEEKKISLIVSRLDSRQLSISTVLQILAQRTDIKLYEHTLGVRDNLQQLDVSIASVVEGARSSISQHLDQVAQIQSHNSAEHTTALDRIATQLKPISDSKALIVDRLDQMLRRLTRAQVDQRTLMSNTTFQGTSTEDMTRIIRAELRRVIPPLVEECLDPYKSNQHAQLEEIRKNLDQIVSDLGHLSVKETACNHERDQKPGSGLHSPELRNDTFLPPHKPLGEVTGKSYDVITNGKQSDDSDGPIWTPMWRRNWSFRWPIGVLTVYISASRCKSPAEVPAFSGYDRSIRYSYSVSIDFRPALSTILARGISIKYQSQQDQRGFYQRCPMLTTFAIVPDDAESFRCVCDGDIKGLKALFNAGLAAPTDRKDSMCSLLSDASILGNNVMCEFLLLEGADPLATNQIGYNCIAAAALGSMFVIRRGITEATRHYSILRMLSRYDSNMDKVATLLMSVSAIFCNAMDVESWGDVYSERNFESKRENDYEKELDIEKTLNVEHKMNQEKKFSLEREICFKAESDFSAGFEPEEDLDGNVSREHKRIMVTSLLNFAKYLCDLGLDMNDALVNDTFVCQYVCQYGHGGLTSVMINIIESEAMSSKESAEPVMTVFLLCILGADVSIRDPDYGCQALHIVFFTEYSIEASSRIVDLAFILMHYGGADPWATTYGGVSPTGLAVSNGWAEEWIRACERCGISEYTLCSKELQRLKRSQYLGDGESTAFDTEEVTPNYSEAMETVTRRKPVTGDRLME